MDGHRPSGVGTDVDAVFGRTSVKEDAFSGKGGRRDPDFGDVRPPLRQIDVKGALDATFTSRLPFDGVKRSDADKALFTDSVNRYVAGVLDVVVAALRALTSERRRPTVKSRTRVGIHDVEDALSLARGSPAYDLHAAMYARLVAEAGENAVSLAASDFEALDPKKWSGFRRGVTKYVEDLGRTKKTDHQTKLRLTPAASDAVAQLAAYSVFSLMYGAFVARPGADRYKRLRWEDVARVTGE